ncbi:Qnr family pentapeptide repeat protein [Erwinia sp. S38]|uniref:Qnr family pentapeptide repeat protein n=1 Tax=Erwinia sp. S38 TaxID=2769338 RepID=UPI00190B14CF|nr:Qnr family pentapeptide repeat protein [Erwinia sp. S38]MBK0000461.1 Qnr family pentapeptide repeat protein [Erwinia sp. S38]
MALILNNEKIVAGRFTGEKIENASFLNCDFSGADLTGTVFTNCVFYDKESQQGANFRRAILKDASFKSCDLTMADFRNASALGIEIRDCRLQGADFRETSFMNMITTRSWFCSAIITGSNLSYANLSKTILEKCELKDNRWLGVVARGATFSGSDLSGGEFASFDWASVNVTHCDLSGAELGDLDLREMNLEGVTLDSVQALVLLDRMGITVNR